MIILVKSHIPLVLCLVFVCFLILGGVLDLLDEHVARLPQEDGQVSAVQIHHGALLVLHGK